MSHSVQGATQRVTWYLIPPSSHSGSLMEARAVMGVVAGSDTLCTTHSDAGRTARAKVAIMGSSTQKTGSLSESSLACGACAQAKSLTRTSTDVTKVHLGSGACLASGATI